MGLSSLLRRTTIAIATVGCLAAASACTDTVYKDRPPFNPPPDANSGFLGYFTAAERQTTCGNCHVGQQADWIQTLHATAWDTLQANPAADRLLRRLPHRELPREPGYRQRGLRRGEGPGLSRRPVRELSRGRV